MRPGPRTPQPTGDQFSQTHYRHGNDSGSDNATTFAFAIAFAPPERIVATADLAAFLTRRLRQLAAPAGESGQPDEAGRWTRTADATQAALPAAL
ncbi:hypothetical protein [Streptomyces pseudovenezuelae]|uniref:Uncharacterized protein n=1 Tax=Streptomyces pseudovenezuelae TaxID=67350 RepID=A0A124H9E1_9ACTN|nr:hypothetical protein [Streptomyces pseudovenezuelae]KUM84666.1 hypothetical protein AQI94_29280 [Streptomyces pseudovenezuelae]